MTHLSTDRLFELLPAFLRLADAEAGKQRRPAGDARDIEDFGPLRTFVIAGSDHPNHPLLAPRVHNYLRWRNAKRGTPARGRRATAVHHRVLIS